MSHFSVLKWPGRVGERLTIEAHEQHEIALVGRGPGQLMGQFAVWMLMPRAGPQPTWGQRHFEVFATGQPVPANATHRGSWVDGQFVWHLFEIAD